MKRRLKETLSESRWRHTEGVVRAAERMAEKFGVTVAALRGANDLPETLYPGLQLVIPGKREGI